MNEITVNFAKSYTVEQLQELAGKGVETLSGLIKEQTPVTSLGDALLVIYSDALHLALGNELSEASYEMLAGCIQEVTAANAVTA